MKRFIGTVLTFIIIIGVLEGCSNIRNTFPNGENKTNGITPTPTITCDMVPYDAQLEIICSEGKLLFSRIATTPRVRAGRPPFDITCVWNYEYEPEIISTLFQVMNDKEITEDHESLPTLQLLLYGQNDDEPWHYLFDIGTDGLVKVTNNDELICCIQISEEELQLILQVLK